MTAFVVKMRDHLGNLYWISDANYPCGRCPVERHEAATFRTPEEAHTSIADLPRFFTSHGIKFAIEPVREDSTSLSESLR